MLESTSHMSSQVSDQSVGAAEELFVTHKQLARRFTWHQKLFRASRVALIVAVVGLVAYVLFAHRLLLQLSPLAFLVALLIPNRGGRERALEHIDEDIGLSYRTALEYQENKIGVSNTGQVDFSSLLLRRATYRVRNLDVPDLQPWWLPMLVTSLVLSLVPFFINATPLNFAGRGLLGNNNVQNPFKQPFQDQETPEDEQAAIDEEAVDEVDELLGEEASDFATQDQNDADLENSFEDSSKQSDRNVSEAEGETLSRFLENLKEKPKVEEDEENNAAQQQGQNRGSSQEDLDNEAEAAQEAEQGRNGEQTSRQNGDSEEASQDNGDNESEGEQQADNGSEDGSEDGEQVGDEQRSGEDEGQGDKQGARAEEGGRQEGDQQDSFSGNDNQNGIGNSASDPTPSAQERLEGQRQTPELLEGQILSDETTVAGDVRIPGSDQVALPEGNSANSARDFDKAVERAIAEGRIPVEYQEILKNYFR